MTALTTEPTEVSRTASQALQPTLGQLGAVLTLVRDAIAWVDVAGRVAWCNPAFYELVAVDGELCGTPIIDSLELQRDGRPVSMREHPAQRVFRENTDITEIYELIVGDHRRVVEVFARRGILQGQPGAVLVLHDITEAARAHSELKVLNAKLEATNAELEAFSYSVSHDLRTPLRAIDGFSQVLLEDYDAILPAEGKDYLRRLRAAAQNMGRLIEGVLRLSRVTRAELVWTDVDLSAMSRAIVGDLAASSPDRRVETVIAPGMIVRGDEQWLQQAMENLIGNAWKFTGATPNARIEVGVRTDSQDGGRVFFVRDNGAGFAMARADKLFVAFQRLHTEEEFPGTGIGLAIVRRIIHRHGGRIWVDAEVGKGATFYFTLPNDMTGTP